MQKVVFISCVKRKKSTPCAAINFYDSSWFKKARDYAKSLNPDRIYILSAKHGLVDAAQEISPYDETLNKMGRAARTAWADKVLDQMERAGIDFNCNAIFLAGQRYRENLIHRFPNATVPMENMPIGKQLQFMTTQT
jgi:hypothetical protein